MRYLSQVVFTCIREKDYLPLYKDCLQTLPYIPIYNSVCVCVCVCVCMIVVPIGSKVTLNVD